MVVRLEGDDYTTEVQAGKHSLIADEPVSFGSNDFGPSPYEYLNASLGACTAMTLKMYARRKSWPLEEMIVHLSYSRMNKYEEHKANPDNKNSRIDRFERELIGDLDDDRRENVFGLLMSLNMLIETT